VFVAYTVRGHAPLSLVLGWALALIGLVFARLPYAQRLVRDPPSDAERTLRFMVWIAFANGALTGAAAPLFFPALPLEERTILTMILVCWTAGGVATAAAYAPAFYAYVTPALLPLAAFWATSGNAESMVLAALIVVFGLLQAFFVRDNQRVVHESFLIRYENERLLEALERERQAVLAARDRAEAANYAKSRFLAAASHDLRQPLHALSLMCGPRTAPPARSPTTWAKRSPPSRRWWTRCSTSRSSMRAWCSLRCSGST
jgi:signal transduction histidine kinase